MQTLGLNLRAKGKEGEPLPAVFHQLEAMGAKIRRGQVTLIAAAPGGGKSAIATTIALLADPTGYGDRIPSLYFSADSDKMTFGTRVMASVLRIHVNDAEKLLLERNIKALEVLDAATGHLWISFDPSPSPKDIDEEVDCFAYVYGEYPHLVVVDNLMDVDAGNFDERMAHDQVIDFCKQLARKTGAAVLILCHVTGQYTDGKDIIPRHGLMNKIDKRPRLILTLHQAGPNQLGVSVVKNSNGPCDADGKYMTIIPWIPERSWFQTQMK